MKSIIILLDNIITIYLWIIIINAILRIDEVDKKGSAKITKSKSGNVMPLPSPIIGGGTKKDS